MTATAPPSSGVRSPARYSATARALHWIVAILVLLMIPAGFIMVQEGIPRALGNTLFIFHKNTGVVVLLLMLVRLATRLVDRPPALPAGLPDWQAMAAGANHLALYVLLFVMPISGYTRVKAGGFPIEWLDALGVPSLVPRSDALAEVAKTVHWIGAFFIVAAIVVHVGAALHHGLIRRDGIVRRIWPPVGRR